MKIIIDICHPAHVNFFKNAISKFTNDGHEVFITGLRRGALPKILEKEYENYKIKFVGKHKGTTFSIIFEANFLKFFKLFTFCLLNKIDIGVSVGSFTLGAALKILGKKNLQFDDDPESIKNRSLMRLTATEIYVPPLESPKGKIKIMKSLKEWAYLSPKYFNPNKEILKEYNVFPKKYIFIREISTKSLNYLDQQSNIITTFAHRLPKQFQIIFSLEDKTTIDKYPSNWILLKEPINDIHSIIYFSNLVISSGDSIAREGAMLGIPSIYCGIRSMLANDIMINKKRLFHLPPDKVPLYVDDIICGKIKFIKQEIFRENLCKEWEDPTILICEKAYHLNK